ncbi:serine--tRNA ligase [Spiroplasma platyhelix]|uniref:Serine--tRNA ligase n=1 Tax=Spiroplasma platyhelix PALS-1 TaxID=1276218 RepID=A0A846TST1_9MOLU|nr:serine--tRNA ligase [Spiroplasma platyhelix]MBE4704192.1 Serine--tRNA ligase [Spiroplasma platyhelix PALS-1]NKE38565.1 serine--tRNA ligase [Spiroplasma platyhelix PALS-1]UJB28776.1 seryl-tRNA synthetase [Spiroplasma platyhelix PALS-1]
MLDIKKIRENYQELAKLLSTRNQDYTASLEKIFKLDQQWRGLVTKTQELEAQRNQQSKLIGQLVRDKKQQEADQSKQLVSKLKTDIDKNNELIGQLASEISQELLTLPNIPHHSVPQGADEDANQEVRKWGKITKETNKPHWEIAEKFKLIDFSRATKLSGSRFIMYTNQGAKLVRALANFMLDQHTQRGYQEQLPPLIVNSNILVGTGQLPKFKDDQFKIADREQYLIPTAEVPLTNIYRDEILNLEHLPIKMCGYTPCFRLEAGSAGKDTRGIIRLHQFNKVELVKIVKPEDSYQELESLVTDAEHILQLLEIPYRVLALCTGDLGFSAAKTYDLELWLPAQGKYREVSSCSNCEDFQARRMNLRANIGGADEKILPHTLNGSGLAIDRVVAAILENYYDAEQNEIAIPKALQPYMNNLTAIKFN